MALELSPYNILFVIALGLLVTVTGGIAYLTLAEWRDRRRRDEEIRATKPKKQRR
jgi:hypothetical protein